MVGRFLKEGQMRKMVFERFGQVDPLPKNETHTVSWRRINNLPVNKAKGALAEGVTPAGTRVTFEDIRAVTEQIGDWIPLTDVLMDISDSNKNKQLVKELMRLLGKQAAEVKEERRADVLKAGSNVFYAGGTVTTRAAVAATIAKEDLRRVERFFDRNRVDKITKMVAASPNYGTTSVDEAFVAVMHPDLKPAFLDIPGFIKLKDYGNVSTKLPGEFGSFEGFRCCEADVVKPWLAAGSSGTTSFLSNGDRAGASDAYDVYPIICLGADAYGIVPLQGEDTVEILVNNPKAATGNELAQKGSLGWKTWDLTARLNESRMARIEVCATAL
jgi:N4-gp56 family major capsid protein